MIFSPFAWSQSISLDLDAGSAAAGATTVLPIRIATQGIQVAAVQWTFIYSTSDFSNVVLQSGPAADSANKTLACNNGIPGQYVCLVYGLNSDTLSDGVITNVTLTVSSSNSNSSAPILIVSPVAASPEGDAAPVVATGSSVTIPNDPMLTGISCSPATVAPPASVPCAVALGSVTARGLVIDLGSVTYQGVTVKMPPSVSIPGGSAEASFLVEVSSAATNSRVELSSSLNGVSRIFLLNVAATRE